jgi:hypothetical protein
VAPLSEADVVGVMEEELGVPWEDVFDRIDPMPLAAGTIAQVHRATLESGDRVVVKVLPRSSSISLRRCGESSIIDGRRPTSLGWGRSSRDTSGFTYRASTRTSRPHDSW